jgi:Zn-dependent metalloprotease
MANSDSEFRRRAGLNTLLVTGSLKTARTGLTEATRRRAQARRASRARLRRSPNAAVSCNKERSIYSAERGYRKPGTLVRKEGDPALSGQDNVPVNEAYDGLGATLDLYCQAYGRNSLDDSGMELIATVHYGNDYDNAFWDGSQMVFGDGDGEVFNRFTTPVDILGHELTHGVTQFEAGLVYFSQPGALNESLSDVFGSLVKQFAATPPQTADVADWKIGLGLLVSNPEFALRDMAHPGDAYRDDPFLGSDPQPADMDHYVRTIDDNLGVHINSGIPNRAFYETAAALGGYAWERAGLIWYETATDPKLRSTANFAQFAQLTLRTARRLYGGSSIEFAAVSDAWKTVKVL